MRYHTLSRATRYHELLQAVTSYYTMIQADTRLLLAVTSTGAWAPAALMLVLLALLFLLALELHRATRICTHPCYSHYLGLLLAARVTGETCVIRTYLRH